MHCTRSSSGCSRYARHLCLIDWGSICLLYLCIVLDLAVGVVVCKASMLNWLGVHLPSIYMHCTRSSSGCSSMQGICAWLTGGFICLLYICIVLDLAVGVVVCKASIFNWLCTGIQGIYAKLTGGSRSKGGCIGMQGICAWLTGGFHLPSIYMHCTRSSSGCSGMQGIFIQLTVYWYSRQLCSIDWQIYQWLYHARHLSWLTGGSICLLYICIVLDLAVVVAVCKASVLDWLGGLDLHLCLIDWGSICLLYLCIVLDLAVGVVVCKASVLNWLGVSICLLYICIVLDLAVGVMVCKASMLQLTVYWYSRHLCSIDWGV